MNDGLEIFFMMLSGAILGFWIGVMIAQSTTRVIPEMVEIAFDKCASNEGLEYFNPDVIVCNNGAEFTYD